MVNNASANQFQHICILWHSIIIIFNIIDVGVND